MRSDLVAYVNTDYLAHNFRGLRSCCRPGVRFYPALKADAYGHGAALVAPVLDRLGAEGAVVATVQEGVELRRAGWRREVLVLGNVLAVGSPAERRERLEAVVRSALAVTACDVETVRLFGGARKSPIDVHIKVDTGMGRMGCMPDQAVAVIRAVRETPGLRLAGIYSHFATADLAQVDLARAQLETYRRLLDSVADELPPGVLRHMANSAATLTFPESHFDMVRPGLALYGYDPAPQRAKTIELRPVLRLVTHLTLVKELPAGHCVGYGQTFTTTRRTRLGIVPAGYFDGYVRGLSGRGVVGLPAGDAPVVGRVSMDQLAVDLTDLPPVAAGTEVTLIDDRPGRPNSVSAIAESLGTIPYEVTCLLGQRIQRVAVGSLCADRGGGAGM